MWPKTGRPVSATSGAALNRESRLFRRFSGADQLQSLSHDYLQFIAIDTLFRRHLCVIPMMIVACRSVQKIELVPNSASERVSSNVAINIPNNCAEVSVVREIGGVGPPNMSFEDLANVEDDVIGVACAMVRIGREFLYPARMICRAEVGPADVFRVGPLITVAIVDLTGHAGSACATILNVAQEIFVMGKDDELKTPSAKIKRKSVR